MAFKMKGSPIKLGSIATKSVLKQKSPAKDKYPDDFRSKEVVEKHNKDYAENPNHDKDMHPGDSGVKMKSPLEQKKIIEKLQTAGKKIKDFGDKYDTGEKVGEAVKKAVSKKVKEYKPTKETTTTSKGIDKAKTATTKTKKKKLLGGRKETTTSTTYDPDIPKGRPTTIGATTTTHYRKKKRGGGAKKKVTIDPDTGKKTVTKYDKEGNVKKTKVKKGDHRVGMNPDKRKQVKAIEAKDREEYVEWRKSQLAESKERKRKKREEKNK